MLDVSNLSIASVGTVGDIRLYRVEPSPKPHSEAYRSEVPSRNEPGYRFRLECSRTGHP